MRKFQEILRFPHFVYKVYYTLVTADLENCLRDHPSIDRDEPRIKEIRRLRRTYAMERNGTWMIGGFIAMGVGGNSMIAYSEKISRRKSNSAKIGVGRPLK